MEQLELFKVEYHCQLCKAKANGSFWFGDVFQMRWNLCQRHLMEAYKFMGFPRIE